ncbi:MAG: mevalonate kinase, partial [Anaerolineales bacterium]
TSASAPGKIILLGEHAVVYHRPALAIPVRNVRAAVTVQTPSNLDRADIFIQAVNLGTSFWLQEAEADDPLAHITRLTLHKLSQPLHVPLTITVESTIPIAAGLGSGAAVSIALARALGQHFQHPFGAQELSDLAFEVEKIHHGTPSGIDNTVIAFDQPVYYVKGSSPGTLTLGGQFTFVIADSGIESSTAVAVGRVRQGWDSNPDRFDGCFDQMGRLTQRGRKAIEEGDQQSLGGLMNENHALLNEIGVGLPQLDDIVQAARAAGALGAKLSGAGLGGNCIALANPSNAEAVESAMRAAGAVWSTQTEVAA